MPSNNRTYGTLQYKLLDGEAAYTWLTAWVLNHQDVIDDNPSNGHNLAVIFPPTAEGCISQLNVNYHMTTDTFEDWQALNNEIRDAIYVGTVATADCDSEFSG